MVSAEEAKVTLPAAHLAADGGQYVVHVPSGQLCARAASQALQAALVSWDQHNMEIHNYETPQLAHRAAAYTCRMAVVRSSKQGWFQKI